ncbi:uncharacterized protein RJT20DRAFT_2594 [Scheffersomyces xylosifermentans]|uniref:uncharacterized protein n=1 Tax=Scheffersomyces xylosifermentans TaxID=1304137 RepID=UPI00315C9CB4
MDSLSSVRYLASVFDDFDNNASSNTLNCMKYSVTLNASDPWWYNAFVAQDCGYNMFKLGNESYGNKDGPDFVSIFGRCNNQYYEKDPWNATTFDAVTCGFARAVNETQKGFKSGASTTKLTTGMLVFLTASIGLQLLV